MAIGAGPGASGRRRRGWALRGEATGKTSSGRGDVTGGPLRPGAPPGQPSGTGRVAPAEMSGHPGGGFRLAAARIARAGGPRRRIRSRRCDGCRARAAPERWRSPVSRGLTRPSSGSDAAGGGFHRPPRTGRWAGGNRDADGRAGSPPRPSAYRPPRKRGEEQDLGAVRTMRTVRTVPTLRRPGDSWLAGRRIGSAAPGVEPAHPEGGNDRPHRPQGPRTERKPRHGPDLRCGRSASPNRPPTVRVGPQPSAVNRIAPAFVESHEADHTAPADSCPP
jgi:hypothetical protein